MIYILIGEYEYEIVLELWNEFERKLWVRCKDFVY